MTTISTKYDTTWPSNGTYSAMIYSDGSLILAEDNEGRQIASGVAGRDDTTIIQAAATALTNSWGILFLKCFDGEYKLTSKITIPAGVSIDSDFATIDISGLNDTVFEWQDGVANGGLHMVALRNLVFEGDMTKTNTLIAKFVRNWYGVIAENIHAHSVCNIIWITGDCYLAKIDNIREYGEIHGGTLIKLDGISSVNPNSTYIRGCWLEPSYVGSSQASYSIYIDGVSNVHISDCHFEGNFLNGIYMNNSVATLAFCTIQQIGVNQIINSDLLVQGISANGCKFTINGGNLTIADCHNVYAGDQDFVAVIGNSDSVAINNCNIQVKYGRFVLSVDGNYSVNEVELSGNYCTRLLGVSSSVGNILNIANPSTVRSLKILSNTFYSMGDADGWKHFINATAINGIIKDNIFDTIGTINTNSRYIIKSYGNLLVESNRFYSLSGTLSFNARDVIKRNIGYVTENSGTSTGTGSEQTIAHGLVATPNKVVIVPTVKGATVSAVSADATNIYVTCTSGNAYNWSAEV